jgi:hypothetical protein
MKTRQQQTAPSQQARKLLVHYLSDREYNEIKKLAIDANETTSEYVTRILREHIERATK